MLNPVFYTTRHATPIGTLTLAASERGLCAVVVEGQALPLGGDYIEKPGNSVLVRACKQLDEYFAGKRTEFNLPLDMRGSVFQIKAWRALQAIPYGSTVSYAQQAANLGDAKKARAVGNANGKNPLLVVVPCHRVIAADGGLGGFSSGLPAKRYLLALEQQAA
jgi:methylated-DNA-[protein]-cysteine S-methyltransferase